VPGVVVIILGAIDNALCSWQLLAIFWVWALDDDADDFAFVCKAHGIIREFSQLGL
jgi:hypothetical protein